MASRNLLTTVVLALCAFATGRTGRRPEQPNQSSIPRLSNRVLTRIDTR
jgi:hypothetical protein